MLWLQRQLQTSENKVAHVVHICFSDHAFYTCVFVQNGLQLLPMKISLVCLKKISVFTAGNMTQITSCLFFRTGRLVVQIKRSLCMTDICLIWLNVRNGYEGKSTFAKKLKTSTAAFKHFAPLPLQCSLWLCVSRGAAGSSWPGGKLPGSPGHHQPFGPAGQLLPLHPADSPVPHQHPQWNSLAIQREPGEHFKQQNAHRSVKTSKWIISNMIFKIKCNKIS